MGRQVSRGTVYQWTGVAYGVAARAVGTAAPCGRWEQQVGGGAGIGEVTLCYDCNFSGYTILTLCYDFDISRVYECDHLIRFGPFWVYDFDQLIRL